MDAGGINGRKTKAVREESLHSNFGFDPQNAMLVDTELTMAGYSGNRALAMHKRMIDALEAIPGVEFVGLSDWTPLVS